MPTPFALRALFAGKKCLSYNLLKTTLAYIQHRLYRSQTMKQKTQGRELSTLVPASFFFSDYDEYAVISYSFTRVVFYLPFLCVHLPFVLRGRSVDAVVLSAEVRPGAGNRVFEICEALYPGRTAVLPHDRRSWFLSGGKWYRIAVQTQPRPPLPESHSRGCRHSSSYRRASHPRRFLRCPRPARP